MANTCSLTNTGLVTALNVGTCLVKVQTHNKKYSAVCRITVVADTSTPSSGWSTNEDNIHLHRTGGNYLIHSETIGGNASQNNSIELESSGRWKVEVDASWVHSTNTWSGNSAVSGYSINFSIDENNTNSSRVATFTGTNLDTNDTAIYTLTQEVKTEQSSIKLFIYEGNETSYDRTNGNITIGDNLHTQQITVVPKIYSNGSWSNYTFNWGGTVTSSEDFVTAISPNLNGTLAQFNSSKLLTFSFLEQRESNANVVVQFKSSTTTPNQALSTITFSLYKNVSELNGKMDIRIFKNGYEITEFDTISKDGEEITITIKTYHHVNGNWVEDDYSMWGASLTVYDSYGLDPICNPQLLGNSSQFAGPKTITITFYPNPNTVQRGFVFRLFSVEDGSGYFNGRKDFGIYQTANDGNYYINPVFQNTPNGCIVTHSMSNRYTDNSEITIPINTSIEFDMKLNTNIWGQPIIYENELYSEYGYLKYNGANYSNSNNNYVPNPNDTDELKTFTISLAATNNEVILKTLSLTITTLTNETYYVNISISHGIEYYLRTNTSEINAPNAYTSETYSFNIYSNIEWEIIWPEFITEGGSNSFVSNGEGDTTISFSLPENQTTEPITGYIVIYAVDTELNIPSVTITVNQPAVEITYYLDIDPEALVNLGNYPTQIYSFDIISNIDWMIQWPTDGMVVAPYGQNSLLEGGTGNASVSFSLTNNETGSSRTTTIDVYPLELSQYSNIYPVQLTLTQNPMPILTVSETSLNIPPVSNDFSYSFNITSNTSWTISWPNINWITDINGGNNLTTSGNGNSLISFKVLDNEGSISRICEITITSTDGTIVCTVVVNQAASISSDYEIVLSLASTSDRGPDYTVNVNPNNYMCTIDFICTLLKKTELLEQNSTDWYSPYPYNQLYIKSGNKLSSNTLHTEEITINGSSCTGQFTSSLSELANKIFAETTIPTTGNSVTSNAITAVRSYRKLCAGVIHDPNIFIYQQQSGDPDGYDGLILQLDPYSSTGTNSPMNTEVTIHYATDLSQLTANFTITDDALGWLFIMTHEQLNIVLSKGNSNNNIVFEPVEVTISINEVNMLVYFYIVGANQSNIFNVQGYQNYYNDNYTLYVNSI